MCVGGGLVGVVVVVVVGGGCAGSLGVRRCSRPSPSTSRSCLDRHTVTDTVTDHVTDPVTYARPSSARAGSRPRRAGVPGRAATSIV